MEFDDQFVTWCQLFDRSFQIDSVDRFTQTHRSLHAELFVWFHFPKTRPIVPRDWPVARKHRRLWKNQSSSVFIPLKQKYESSTCPEAFKQLCGHTPVDSGNRLKFQKCSAQSWRNFELCRQRKACRFFQASGLLA